MIFLVQHCPLLTLGLIGMKHQFLYVSAVHGQVGHQWQLMVVGQLKVVVVGQLMVAVKQDSTTVGQ